VPVVAVLVGPVVGVAVGVGGGPVGVVPVVVGVVGSSLAVVGVAVGVVPVAVGVMGASLVVVGVAVGVVGVAVGVVAVVIAGDGKQQSSVESKLGKVILSQPSLTHIRSPKQSASLSQSPCPIPHCEVEEQQESPPRQGNGTTVVVNVGDGLEDVVVGLVPVTVGG